MRKYKFKENIFNVIDSPEKAYWLGFLMADGCISKKHGLRLGLADFDMIYKFKDFMGGLDNPIKDVFSFRSHTKQITFQSKVLFDDLQKYGLIPNKTKRTQIQNIPDEFINSFILGYFDGDGCIYLADKLKKSNKCRISISSSSVKILEQIRDNLKSNDISSKLDKIKNKECWNLFVTKRYEVTKFYNYIYKDCNTSLQRKKEKFIDFINRKNKFDNKSSKYVGVYKHKSGNYITWVAHFNCKYIGNFKTENEAAMAYNNKLIELNYPKDRLNIII